MDFPAVIAQLRAQAPMFGQRVAGADAFEQTLVQQVWMTLPAAFVKPVDEEAEPNEEQNALYQVVKERIAVIVEFDNSMDRRGQTATEQFQPTKLAIFAAILNWRGVDPDHALRGFEYAGGHELVADRARLFYQFEFLLTTVITDADGWQVSTPYLTEIDANSDPGEPAPPFKYVATENAPP